MNSGWPGGRLRLIVAGLVALTVVLLVVGFFGAEKIPPRASAPPKGEPAPAQRYRVERVARLIWYEAVGTVRSRAQATVSSQVTGRIVEVAVDAGAQVDVGTLLARIEDEQFRARVAQARSALEAAQAGGVRSEAAYGRVQELFRKKAATQEQLEAAEADAKQGRASIDAAAQKLSEARAAYGYTRIQSPIAGVVAERFVDPGDLALSGKALFVVHHPRDLRLEASVREGMIGAIHIGQKVEVDLTSADATVAGTVSEVVPSADPVSRSFLVKVLLPQTDGLYPGMFGKLRVPVGERSTIVVPREAIVRVGQLTTVRVLAGDRWERRNVTVGTGDADVLEILSGLSAGDTVGWN